MRLATLRRTRHDPLLPGLHGPARVERRAGALARRAKPGDLAVIEHLDLDGPSAQLLVDARVAAVVNAAPSISGRYPNIGPQLLVEAGIPLLDSVGPEVMRLVDDGEKLRLDGDTLYRGDQPVCHGALMTPQSVGPKEAEFVVDYDGGTVRVPLVGDGLGDLDPTGGADEFSYYECNAGGVAGLAPMALAMLGLLRRRRR